MFKNIKPKIRSDAKLNQIDQFNYALINPDSNATCILDSAGYMIAEQFETGENSVEQVQLNLRDQFNLRVDTKQLFDFVSKVNSLGLLETSLEELGVEAPSFESANLEFKPKSNLEVTREVEELYQQLTGDLGFFHKFDKKTLFTILFGVFFFFFPWQRKASGPVLLEPLSEISIRSMASGTVEEVFVREGDFVKKNQPLIRLRGYQDEISRKISEIKKIDAELDQLKKGATKEEVEETKKQVELAGQILSQAQSKYNRYSQLKKKGLISEQTYEEVRSDWKIKQKELDQAKAKLKLVKTGTRPELIQAKQAEKESLLLDLKFLEKKDEDSLVRSQISGVVSTPNVMDLAGKSLSVGEFIMKITEPTQISVAILINENYISEIKPGSSIKFKVHALPNQTFSGEVTRISPVAQENPITPDAAHQFRVYADLKNSNPKLRPGMTGKGLIPIDWRPLGFIFFYDVFVKMRVLFVI